MKSALRLALFSASACVLWMGQASMPAGLAQPSTGSAPMPIATISTGQLRGYLSHDGIAIFEDIPYAQPPVGNLRWQAPLPAKAWTGIRDATVFGPECVQGGRQNAAGSEDCLQLNIWAPAWPMKSPAPVMLWFHGGGNVQGSGIGPIFDGQNFARLGVVLVTTNYRLGVFGFFAHPELTKESPHHASGNYGLLDQIMAMRWVRDNIAAFGGDPANVTIFGESAGSIDVMTLLTSPESEGLFARAIAESGAPGDAQSLAEAEKRGEAIAASLGITGDGALAKLRAVSSSDLLKASSQQRSGGGGGVMQGIDIDGWVLPESPAKAFAEGREHKVALLFGGTSQEVQKPLTPLSGDLRTTISKFYGPLANRALALYGLNGATGPQADPELGTVEAQWATDSTFRCATIEELVWHAAAGNTAYEYQFSRTVHGRESEGAPHASELPFVFDNLYAWRGIHHYDLSDRQYATMMQQYWVNFAKSGDPNEGDMVQWPKFDSVGRAYLDFMDSGPVAKEGLRRQACDLFMENQKRLWEAGGAP
jgi:para-nitrobenzyl esterase